MKIFVRRLGLSIAGILLLLTSGAARPAETASGTWSIEPSDREGAVEIELRHSSGKQGHWTSSFTIPFSELEGLTAAQVASPGSPVRFTLRRDAGSFSFEGSVRRGEGSGRFSFSPDAAYAAEMRSTGYRLSEDDVLAAALHDVSRRFAREISALGYGTLHFDDLVAFRIHGVTPDVIRELESLGYRHVPAEDLVAMRIHGATPEFIARLKSLGYERVDGDDLVAMRIHGVSPEFISELKTLGYSRVSPEDLVAMRIHGVTTDYVRRQNAGRTERYSIDDLVSMKIHRIGG